VRDGALVALPFDLSTLAVGTGATTIIPKVPTEGALNGRFDVSQNGLLAYFGQLSNSPQFLRWLDRAGNRLGDLTDQGIFYSYRIAPDGRRVAADRSDDTSTGGRSVWIYDSGQPPTRVTFGGLDEWGPVWSPDGEKVAFMSCRDGPGDLYVKSLRTAGPEEALLTDGQQKGPLDWSADGRFLAYLLDRTDSRSDIWVLPVAPKGRPIPIATRLPS
jgi:Tol biopolymer transport system component